MNTIDKLSYKYKLQYMKLVKLLNTNKTPNPKYKLIQNSSYNYIQNNVFLILILTFLIRFDSNRTLARYGERERGRCIC